MSKKLISQNTMAKKRKAVKKTAKKAVQKAGKKRKAAKRRK